MGLDSSTQSLSAVILDLDDGRVVAQRSVSFGDELPEFGCPHGFLNSPDPLVRHSDPLLWAAALDRLFAALTDEGIDLRSVVGISGSGQQHGTVYLNHRFCDPGQWSWTEGLAELVRPMLSRATAPIWMDSSTSIQCREIAEAAGGEEMVRERTGSPPIERFSGPQIRKFSRLDPGGYERTEVVHLVSSFMCSLLVGHSAPIDPGDGAGMNLLNLSSGDWDPVLLCATAPGLRSRLPPVVACDSIVGELAPYFTQRYGFSSRVSVVAWSGDNPNSLVGVGGWRPGIAVVSLGTSDTYFAAMHEPTGDPDGFGHVFGNPAGGFMSLICFKNGALARDQVRDEHGLSWEDFERCLQKSPPGNDGNMMLPYFVPEITPVVLNAQPVYRGHDAFVNGRDVAARMRAVVEAQALRLRQHTCWIATQPQTLRVTGGGAANTAICQVLADVFNAQVVRLRVGNSAALGAAMRAANGIVGSPWEELTAAFCGTAEAMNVHPIPANVAVYKAMAPRFAQFARQFGA